MTEGGRSSHPESGRLSFASRRLSTKPIIAATKRLALALQM
jgi:hypothetical protein